MIRRPPRSTLFPYTRSSDLVVAITFKGKMAADRFKAIVIEHLFKVAGRKLVGAGKLDVLDAEAFEDRKSTRLNSSHSQISYAVFCLKKKNDAPCSVSTSDYI